jgi:hypothetical protein
MEALIFELVCSIDFPVNEIIHYREIQISDVTNALSREVELPYISDSFFNTLLNKVKVSTII